MAAFRNAVSLGFTYVETDVHTTADGVLLLFHDDSLDRVTDGRGRIAELTAEAVARARIGGTEPIPLFEDLVREFPGVTVQPRRKGLELSRFFGGRDRTARPA